MFFVRILEIILFEFLLGYILQAFSIVLGLYAFNKQKIDVKKYIITSSVMSVVIYVARLLPVAFGVHIILNYVVLFLFGILYFKQPVIRSVIAVMAEISFILLIEFLTSFIMVNIIGKDQFFINYNDSLGHYIMALPSTIIIAAVILLIYKYTKHTKIKKGSFDEDSRDRTI